MFRSLRLRLTAWYLLFFTALLIAFCGFLYGLLARHLHQSLDAMLFAQAGTATGLVQDEITELKGDIPAAAAEVVAEMRSQDTIIAVFEGARLVASSDPKTLLQPAAYVERNRPSPVMLTGRQQGSARALRVPFDSGGRRYSLAVVAPLAPVMSQLRSLRQVFFAALPLALLVAGFGGFMLAAKSLAPLVAMSEQTTLISEKNLHARLHAGHPSTELARLAEAFNSLLARLDHSFETMRQFMADASHELRTPLSVIRGETDVALSQERGTEEYRQILQIVRDEAKRLSRLVDDLLNLSRADAGHRPLKLEDFYLDDVLEECCRSVQALASRKRIQVSCSCPEDVPFRGDQELFHRLVFNLLDNAVRYTPEGGTVSVKLAAEQEKIRIAVSDTGAGIPPESAPHIFERFYRVDKARSRGEGGFGLGLSIAKWIAESHRGTLELSSTSERGSTFTISLSR